MTSISPVRFSGLTLEKGPPNVLSVTIVDNKQANEERTRYSDILASPKQSLWRSPTKSELEKSGAGRRIMIPFSTQAWLALQKDGVITPFSGSSQRARKQLAQVRDLLARTELRISNVLQQKYMGDLCELEKELNTPKIYRCMEYVLRMLFGENENQPEQG